jgi:hypothetical protein
MSRTQEIRYEVLLQLYGSGAIPISAEHIQKVAKRGGFDYSATEIRDQLHFLIGQEFARDIQQPGTGETRYGITSKGMLEYERTGN